LNRRAVCSLLLAGTMLACGDAIGSSSDSLRIWDGTAIGTEGEYGVRLMIEGSGSEVNGWAIVTFGTSDLTQGAWLVVSGALTSHAVDLEFRNASGGPTRFNLRGSLAGDMLIGGISGMPLSMKRAKLRIAGVSGRYVLTHYDGLPLADGPGHVHFDSLFLDTDGRARRHRSQMSLSYNRPGVYERRGDWIVFSYSPV